jgi:AraC-like DNA-binding protein
MLTDPANEQSLDALAEQNDMSQRTLRQRFIADVGIAPGQWRQQAKLLFAFAAAFRRVFGQSPTKYLMDA